MLSPLALSWLPQFLRLHHYRGGRWPLRLLVSVLCVLKPRSQPPLSTPWVTHLLPTLQRVEWQCPPGVTAPCSQTARGVGEALSDDGSLGWEEPSRRRQQLAQRLGCRNGQALGSLRFDAGWRVGSGPQWPEWAHREPHPSPPQVACLCQTPFRRALPALPWP